MPGTKPPRLLIFDDDLDFSENLADIFYDAGFKPGIAQYAATAVDLLLSHPYEFVIVDYQLPDANGLELFEWIQEQSNELCGVMVAGAAPTDIVTRARQAELWSFMRKPVDIGRLVGIARHAREMHGAKPMGCAECHAKTKWFHRELQLYFCTEVCLRKHLERKSALTGVQ